MNVVNIGEHGCCLFISLFIVLLYGASASFGASLTPPTLISPDAMELTACQQVLMYDPGVIIPDNEVYFVDIPVEVIQQFLADKGSVLAHLNPASYEAHPNDGLPAVAGRSPAELKNNGPATEPYSPAGIIYRAAKEHNVNPVLLLAYLQRESRLVEREPQSIQNTAECGAKGRTDSKYASFPLRVTRLSSRIRQDISGFTGAYTKTVEKTVMVIKSAFAHFHYRHTPSVRSAETLFRIYSSENNYRGYFLNKGYGVCDGSQELVSSSNTDDWIPLWNGFDLPAKEPGWHEDRASPVIR